MVTFIKNNLKAVIIAGAVVVLGGLTYGIYAFNSHKGEVAKTDTPTTTKSAEATTYKGVEQAMGNQTSADGNNGAYVKDGADLSEANCKEVYTFLQVQSKVSVADIMKNDLRQAAIDNGYITVGDDGKDYSTQKCADAVSVVKQKLAQDEAEKTTGCEYGTTTGIIDNKVVNGGNANCNDEVTVYRDGDYTYAVAWGQCTNILFKSVPGEVNTNIRQPETPSEPKTPTTETLQKKGATVNTVVNGQKVTQTQQTATKSGSTDKGVSTGSSNAVNNGTPSSQTNTQVTGSTTDTTGSTNKTQSNQTVETHTEDQSSVAGY